MEDLKKIQEFFSKPLEENTFKKGDKVTYLGNPAEITFVGKDQMDRTYYSVSYDKGNGKTKASNLYNKDSEIKAVNEMDANDPVLMKKQDLKEFGSSDMNALLSSMHINLGYPKEFPGLSKIIDAAGDATDFYMDDFEEYSTNRDELVMSNARAYARREFPDFMAQAAKFIEPVDEAIDANDPVLMKMRAAKDKLAKMRAANAGDDGNDKFFDNAKKIAFLKKEREQLMRDMEQEAEPEGGPIADEYGDKLNRIDRAIAKLSGRKEMTYDQAIAEGESKMPTQDQVDRFFALTQNETHYLNSKPVAGQEGTFNLMPIEPWDEYDLSNWNSLVRKAKAKGKSLAEMKVGDKVTFKSGGDDMEIIGVRDMFASDLKAYRVKNADGETFEYSEDQLQLSEASKGAMNYFSDLKFNYQKAFRYLDVEEREEYKRLVKDFFSKLQVDDKVRAVGLDEAKRYSTYEIRMVNQIRRAKKDGEPMYNLPLATQNYYRKNKAEMDALVAKEIDFLNKMYDEYKPKDEIGKLDDQAIAENDSYARVSMPRFVKDKNNPNFLNVYIDYDLGPGGASIVFGKETMTGQIRRLSAAKAMRLAGDVARDLEAEYNLEDIEITDLENGKVRIFAVSDDFINMDPNMLGENTLLKQAKLSSAEYQKAKKLKDFNKDDYKWNPGESLYIKLNESIAQTLAETIKLGAGVIEEELCPKGKAYIKRRKAAGEKSSAYLSGRAVKVCKGQMSGRKKKK